MKRWRLLEKKRKQSKVDNNREILQQNIRYIIRDELIKHQEDYLKSFNNPFRDSL